MHAPEFAIEFHKLLEIVEFHGPDATAYIDLETGGVYTVLDELFGEPSESYEFWSESARADWPKETYELVRQIADDTGGRYLRVPPELADETRDDMAAFCATIDDPSRRAALEATIEGPDARQRFNHLLVKLSPGHCRWVDFQFDCAVVRIRKWLASRRIGVIEEE